MRFEKLFQPGRIGNLEIKNRIVLPGMVRNYADEHGYVSEQTKAHYEAMARGGVGFIIVEATRIDNTLGKGFIRDLAISDERYVPGLKELAQIIHNGGAKVALQLYHPGSSAKRHFIASEPISSSAIAMPGEALPRALRKEEIPGVIALYTKAVARAREAGFDAVEIHANHRDLINQFLSAAWNKRDDEYGGELRNRARFMLEVVRSIKATVGADFPLGLRINGAEYGVEGGTTPEESQTIAPWLQEAGAAFIHVSAYGFGSKFRRISQPDQIFYPEPPPTPPPGLDMTREGAGAFVPMTAAIKKMVSIPVIAVGRLDPELAENIIAEGKADFVAFARRLLADPELPSKLAEGRLDDIRPCTACLTCRGQLDLEEPVLCQVNAGLGKEKEFEIKPADRKKKVMVIGAGPAGMEAARVAALRGHQVSIYDKQPRLGGVVPIAALIKEFKAADLLAFKRYLEVQVKKLGVEVRLSQEVTPATVEKVKPNVLIIAAGSVHSLPDLPGINRRNVLGSAALHRKVKTFLRIFSPTLLGRLTHFYLPVGKKAVIIGGLIQGCQVAGFLTKRGRNVTILETSNQLGTGMVNSQRLQLLEWLASKRARTFAEVKFQEITDKGVVILTKEGKTETIEGDTILVTMPAKPNSDLAKAMEGKVTEVYVIGDSNEPHLIVDAVRDGRRVGCTI